MSELLTMMMEVFNYWLDWLCTIGTIDYVVPPGLFIWEEAEGLLENHDLSTGRQTNLINEDLSQMHLSSAGFKSTTSVFYSHHFKLLTDTTFRCFDLCFRDIQSWSTSISRWIWYFIEYVLFWDFDSVRFHMTGVDAYQDTCILATSGLLMEFIRLLNVLAFI